MMGHLTFAFSVHGFINKVGSDAGFASIIGLAILVLLYFAQARETATLRAQAAEAAERAQQLELRLMQLARQSSPAQQAVPVTQPPLSRPVASPVGRSPASVPAPAGAVAVAGAPAPPAGVGAPALTAATKLVPTGSRAGLLDAPPPASTAVAAPAGASTAAPPPATAAGGANGVPSEPVGQPMPTPAPRVQQPARAQIRPAGAPPAARRGAVPSRTAAARRSPGSRAGRWLMLAIGGLAVAAVVAVLLLATGGSGGKRGSSAGVKTTNAPSTRHASRPAAVNPASVTVGVLNGTSSDGLAHRVSVQLSSAGYKQGAVATASDQTQTATVVGYAPGHKRDALAVAATLKLGSASVQPVNQSAQAVACPPPSACAEGVIVTVGTDLANAP